MFKDLVEVKQENFNQIITRADDPTALQFRTIDKKALQEINDFMPIVNEKTSAFQKQNSQTTMSLMTMNMVDAGPFRVLRQILAQIERKRSALKENLYKLEVKKIKYQDLQEKSELTSLEELRMKKYACDIIDSQGPIEAALKELGALKRRYEEVVKNNNIPENWNEQDFEEAEIKHHITAMFRNAIRDRLQGSHNMGTLEYFEQFGISPITAYAHVDNFIRQNYDAITKGVEPNIQSYYNFYDAMYQKFKNEYKHAMKRIGLDSITYADFLMKNN